MAITNIEVGSVWKLMDMQWGRYDEGEPLLHEANYGYYASQEGANRAAQHLKKCMPICPGAAGLLLTRFCTNNR